MSVLMDPSGADSARLTMGAIFNLAKARVMVVDDNNFSLRLITQTLLGFGVKASFACQSGGVAKNILKTQTIDLLIVDCEMPEIDGYDLVSWLRASAMEPNSFVPILMVSGHTQLSNVTKARDCGASFIVARPLTPTILLDRILWLARDSRPFVQAQSYLGPDRRFKDLELADGQEERRADRIRADKVAAEAGPEQSGGIAA